MQCNNQDQSIYAIRENQPQEIKWVKLSLQILLRNQRNPRTYPPNLPKGRKRTTKIKYEDVFKEDASKLKEVSEEIIRVEDLLKNPSKQHELLTHEWATQTIWAYALQQQHCSCYLRPPSECQLLTSPPTFPRPLQPYNAPTSITTCKTLQDPNRCPVNRPMARTVGTLQIFSWVHVNCCTW